MIAALALVLLTSPHDECFTTTNSTGYHVRMQLSCCAPVAGGQFGWFISRLPTGAGDWFQLMASYSPDSWRPQLYASDLCIGTPFYRMGTARQVLDPQGILYDYVDRTPLVWAGRTMHFQGWYTDWTLPPGLQRQFTRTQTITFL